MLLDIIVTYQHQIYAPQFVGIFIESLEKLVMTGALIHLDVFLTAQVLYLAKFVLNCILLQIHKILALLTIFVEPSIESSLSLAMTDFLQIIRDAS